MLVPPSGSVVTGGLEEAKSDYAMAVGGGVVRAVYKIDGWVKPTEEDIAKAPNRLGRHGFVGHVRRWKSGICSPM